MTRLEVLVCTLGEAGLARIASHSLPSVDGVAYVISCQSDVPCPAVPPSLAARPDVRVVFTPTRGLSINRNHALSVARAPYVLIADDDIDFFAEGLARIIRIFDAEPTTEILTLRCKSPDTKAYPPDGHNLNVPFKGYYLMSVEIALRLDAVRRAGVEFTPSMGIGNDFITQGEEEVFVLDALARGLTGRHVDVFIAVHESLSTGCRSFGPGAMRARGVVLAITHPRTLFLRAVVIAWRLRRNAPVLRSVKDMLVGARFARRNILPSFGGHNG